MVDLRIFPWILLAIIVIAIFFIYNIPPKVETSSPTLSDKSLDEKLSEFTKNIISGGPPPDGIPPIENPKFVSVKDADDFLNNNDIVFGIVYGNEIKAYPQKILVWHEIVNDEFNGEKISVTYCPLTGSVIGFKGELKDGNVTTFGTSGNLVNSNLVMYDRNSKTWWPQVLSQAIAGQRKGEELESVSLVWATWEKWKGRYPNSLVLSQETGFIRPYGNDPYGSYLSTGNYYDSGGPFFPVMRTNNTFSDKKVIIGVKVSNLTLAIGKDEVKLKNIANIDLGNEKLVAIYDKDLDDVRVFSRVVDNKTLDFKFENGRIFDSLTNSEWTALGNSVSGTLSGNQLTQIASMNVMWFGWYAFYPETQVYV